MRASRQAAILAGVAMAGVVAIAQSDGFKISVKGASGPVNLYDVLDRTKPKNVGTSDASGTFSLIGNELNITKLTRLTAMSQKCPNDNRLALTLAGSDDEQKCRKDKKASSAGDDKNDCNCKVAGAFLWGESVSFRVGGVSPTTLALIGAAGVAGAAVAAKGGGDSGSSSSGGSSTPAAPAAPTGPTGSTGPTTPAGPSSGTFRFVVVAGGSDPGNHKGPIGLASEAVATVTINGNAITVRFTSGTQWIDVNGTIDTTTGQVSASGRGTVGPVANSEVRLTGTVSASGTSTLTYAMGTDGSLPGGQAATYNVQVTRQ